VAPTELLGSSMLEVYPLPSLSETHGMAMGFVLRGRDLFLGVNSDRGATPHLHALVEGMENELGLLRRAATGAPIRLEETAPSARPAGRKPVKEPEEPPATLAAFHERLTQLDHAFLIFEDTGAPMHVATVQTYEAGPLKTATGELDIEGMRQYTLSRLDQVPRYRQRIARTPLQGHPVWIDDDRFDIQYHLRHTRLPKPGTERQLKRLVGRIVSQQLDRGKPLWEMWAIEGLEGDRFAILNKTHHCMIDGIAGVDLLAVLLSPEPIEKIPPLPEWIPRPAPDTRELLTGEVRRWSGAPLALASNLWKLARDENHVRDDLAERLRAAGSILQTGLRYASNTPLNQPIGPHRRFDWLPMDLREIRAIKNRLGGTVNDVVITIATRAIRRFLMESRHVDVQGLDYRILAPVSTRTDEQRGTTGNRVSSWIVNLPLEEKDPVRAFERIHATTEELKKSKQALGAETLTQATEWTGTTLLSLGAQIARVGRLFNIVVTNVPGPQLPLYLLGSRMLEIHPIVPLFGNLSMGIALFSYDGTLHWGVMADRELVPDLHDFILALEESLDELRKAKP
jgi:WS/DGAT/MGAT family acyltransferase